MEEVPPVTTYTPPSKLSAFLTFIRTKKAYSIASLVILGAVIPATIFLSMQSQDIRQKADANLATLSVNPASAKAGDTVSLNWSIAQPTTPPNCSNLVQNNSFESPTVVNTTTQNSWQLYGAGASSNVATTENIPGWDPRATNSGYQVEVHRGMWGNPADGSQSVEVDVPGVISLTQSISTNQGEQFKISFFYSSRPDFNGTQKLGVYWNGQQIGTVDGTSHGTTLSWQEKTFTVSASGNTGKLGFGALADSTAGAGNLIDNVSVKQISGACGTTSPTNTPTPFPPAPTIVPAQGQIIIPECSSEVANIVQVNTTGTRTSPKLAVNVSLTNTQYRILYMRFYGFYNASAEYTPYDIRGTAQPITVDRTTAVSFNGPHITNYSFNLIPKTACQNSAIDYEVELNIPTATSPGTQWCRVLKRATATLACTASLPLKKDHIKNYSFSAFPVIPKAYAQTAITGAETYRLYMIANSSGTLSTPQLIGGSVYLANCQSQSSGGDPPTVPKYSGQCSYQLPSTLQTGSYVFRAFATDGQTKIGESNVLSVTANNVRKTTKLFFALPSQTTAITAVNANAGSTGQLEVMIDPGVNLPSFMQLAFAYDPNLIESVTITPNAAVVPAIFAQPAYSSGLSTVTVSTGADPTRVIQSLARIATLTVKVKANVPSGSTLLRFVENSSLVLSIASDDQPSENVLSSTTPTTITIVGTAITPTPTAIPTATPTPTPVPGCPTPITCPAGKRSVHGDPQGGNSCPVYACIDNPAQISLKILVPGINARENTSPKQIQRPVKIQFINSQNAHAGTLTATATFEASPSGAFIATVDVPSNIAAGNYTTKVSMPKYLVKQTPGIQTILPASVLAFPTITLVAGDIDNDNRVDIVDYNLLASCYGAKANSAVCQETKIDTLTQKEASDLNDDGVVDGIDYNLFIIGLATKQGD